MTESSLIVLSKASQMLAEATTIQKAKELKDLALTAMDWAKRKGMGEEMVQKARFYALQAERRMGELLAQTPRATGARGIGPVIAVTTGNRNTQPTLAEIGITKRESAEAQFLFDMTAQDFEEVATGQVTLATVKRETKRKVTVARLEDIKEKKTKETLGLYDVIIVDPPWPMEKIKRDERPNQVGFDYPTMGFPEISAIHIPAAEDCHLWLWTTQKILPIAFDVLEAWKFHYICAFVWHKPGGFQPIGLPQYNCEFVLYARYGKPMFIDTKAFNVCFQAKRGRHSEKPDEFYETVRRVTAGRRLDMFARRAIEGFDAWGNEA